MPIFFCTSVDIWFSRFGPTDLRALEDSSNKSGLMMWPAWWL